MDTAHEGSKTSISSSYSLWFSLYSGLRSSNFWIGYSFIIDDLFVFRDIDDFGWL